MTGSIVWVNSPFLEEVILDNLDGSVPSFCYTRR